MFVSFGFFYLGLIDKRNKKKDLRFLAYLTKEMKRKVPKSGSERSTGAVAGGVPAMAVGGLRLNSRVISGQPGKNAITVNHNEKPLTGLIDKAKAVGRGCGRWAEIRQT